MARSTIEARFERVAAYLIREYPERLVGSFSQAELVDAWMKASRQNRGRPVGTRGRQAPEDDRHLYVMAFLERTGIAPETTLTELLGKRTKKGRRDHERILAYYRRHTEGYRDAALVLRSGVTAATAEDLLIPLTGAIIDDEEFVKTFSSI